MKHRGFFYFIFISFFFYVVVFSKIVYSKKNVGMLTYQKPAYNEKKADSKNYIVETFIETKKPKDPKYISNLNSKEQGKLTKSKDYSYFTDIRYFAQVIAKKKSEIEKGSESQSEFTKEDEKQAKKSLMNPLPNFYTRKQVSINLNSEGFVGLSAEKKPYTQYLLVLAKKIFYNWVRFLPADQIRKALIVTASKDGTLAGTVAIYFAEDSNRYSAVMVQPYYSENMNNLTIRSFEYLGLPVAPKDVKLRVVMIRLKVNANTLRAEANFKFDLLYKDKKVSQ